MSLSADAPIFQPPNEPTLNNTVAVPITITDHTPNSSHQQPTSHPHSNRGGGGHHFGRGGRGGQSHQRGGRGGNRPQSAAAHDSQHDQQQHQQPQGRGGGRGGGGHRGRGGGDGGGRGRGGGGRGGGRGGHHHQQHPQSSPDTDLSEADAAAIEAAMMEGENHAITSSPPLRPSTAASSHHHHPPPHHPTQAELNRSLLGFKYEPTTLQQTRYVSKPKTFPKGKTAEVFNKSVYMQANHHFILGADDPSSFLLPDHPVDWTKVELVICPVDNAIRTCPICMEVPVAAKITKCGHVYCDTCLIHYLSLSDRSWARCPLCFDAVYPQALRSAEFRVQKKYSEGDYVDFVLCRRYKDCVNAVPIAPSTTSTNSSVDSVLASNFARIQLTTDISSIVQRELRELFQSREVSRASGDDFTLTYIDRAEAAIVKRIEDWSTAHPFWRMTEPTYEQMKHEEEEKYAREKANIEREKARLAEERAIAAERAKSILSQTEAWPALPPPAKSQTKPTSSTVPSAAQPTATSTTASTLAASPSPVPPTVTPSPSTSPAISPTSSSPAPSVGFKSTSSFFDAHESQAEHRFNQKQAENQRAAQSSGVDSSSNSPSIKPTTNPDSVYYFYQSVDGQQLYLHSLNFRSLLLTYNNDLQALPTRIRGKIIHSDSYVVDLNVRSKFRFLSHLPLTATFKLTLVEFSSGMIPKSIQQQMAPEFAADRQHRQQAAKKQRELNKRTIQSVKAQTGRDSDTSTSSASSRGGAYQPWRLEEDASSFPDLNPLGLASGAPPLPTSNSNSPELRGQQAKKSNWNIVAEKGLASAELWEPLAPAAPAPQATTSHWGASSTPLSAKPSGSLSGSSTGGWGRSAQISQPNANTSNTRHEEPEEEAFPAPSVDRKGRTTLLSTTSRRNYK